jgi:LacI family transcriptional regulator
VTIQDVAELAGVSIATVSRVLHSHPDVSPETRSEVLKSVRELGYVSNRIAEARPNGRPRTNGRARASGRTRLIGLAVPDMRNDYVTEIVTSVVEALHDRDARLVICSRGREEAGGSIWLREQLVPGVTHGALLILPSDVNGELVALQKSGYPFVVIEPTMPIDEGIPAVAATNWAGARAASEHLIALGHTHIGLITGPSEWRITADRLAGYQAALLAAGLPLARRVVQEADMTIEGGYEAALRLLTLPHAPTAIFALNDAMAVGTLRAAREQGLTVPQDLSIVGFDDVEMASITTPALTTVQQPLQGLGRVGADVLWRLLQGEQLDATRMELSTRLVVRESTAPPRGTSFLTV